MLHDAGIRALRAVTDRVREAHRGGNVARARLAKALY